MRYLFRIAAAALALGVTPVATSTSPEARQAAPSPAGVSPAAQSVPYDVIIRNGRVLDGSGNPWLRADVAIRGGVIAAVGRLDGATATTIVDAANRYVAPGFIDVHSHAGEGLSRAELRQARPLVAQGVTTIVVNPDGGGPVDLAAQRAALEAGGAGVNVALLVGHGSVRSAVVKGDVKRAPTDDELTKMKALVRTGMEQGAFGLSSGLFYTPGSFAKTEEVISVAAVAGEFGGVYTSHIRDEGDYGIGVVASVEEVIRIAEEGRLTGIVSHMKALGPDNWGLSMAITQRIDQARARGIPVFADQYPYEASSTSLRGALLPGGVELPAASAGDADRQRVLGLLRENIRRRGGPAAIQIASYQPDRSIEGRTLDAIARARSVAPEIAALDILARGNPSIVSFNMSEADIRQIMVQPYTMASSDGGLAIPGASQPHPRNNGAYARRLAHYVRDQKIIGVEFAVRSMTSLPAAVFGMKGRGVIAEGAVADVVIFDLDAVRDRATYADPHQIAEGMAWVLVNGVPVVRDGEFTGALPGKVLRRSR